MLLRPIAVIAVVYIIAAGYMYLFQRDFVFRPHGTLSSPEDVGLNGVVAEQVPMQDGTTITVWRRPPDDPQNPTVLYFHGNGGNLTGRAKRYQQIIDSGFGLYAPTYRGYPGAGGSPSEAALIADGLEHFDRVAEANNQVVLHGESLGTGVAVAVAANRDASALILEAPYTGAADIAAETYPWLPVYWLMKDPLLSRERIGDVTEPLLVVHGTGDRTIPYAQGQALFDMANEPKEIRVVEDAGHMDLWLEGLWPASLDFLARNGVSGASIRQ
ncbi:MAG: alpha/beta hydrolase [Pseudomonadota bacterium]